MKPKVLFLTLKVFAATGGIEKVCRVAGKAFFEWSVVSNSKVWIFSMYDIQSDADNNKYFPTEIFRGFGTAKLKFILQSLWSSRNTDEIFLSHINLLPVGWLIKLFYPQKKLILFAHGIEVWSDFGRQKKMMLEKCDLILSVSQFTADVISNKQKFPKEKIKILNNCLDPFLPPGKEYVGNDDLRKKYGYQKDDKILFTLTRLSSRERYKGYDKVLEAMVAIREKYPDVKYLIAGSFDEQEKKFLMETTLRMELDGHFKMAGFIPDEELVAHFSMADIYVMPSMKEGFGIVFIEAMYYGLPVIAGNKDGSVDALLNGELGTLVDPLNTKAIGDSIEKILEDPAASVPDKNKLMSNFSYEQYKQKIEAILESQL